MANAPALSIGDIAVRQLDGLYSLNDLHKASGGADKHQPAKFIRLDQAQDLIAALDNSPEVASLETAAAPSVKTKEGRNGGTYACRELVIAYAAWINAEFHLKVIRVFLNAVLPTAPYTVQPSDTLNEAQQIALRTLLETSVKRLPHGKQAGAMVQGWSKLKAHFGVTYRQIPAHEFTEALSIISRHVAQWEVADESPKPTTAPQLISYAARSKAAFDAATRAAGEVQRTVFDAVMNGNDDWKHQRLLLAFVTDSATAAPAYVQPIESGSLVATWARLTEDISSGECLLSNQDLLAMTAACTGRLSTRAHRFAHNAI